MRHPYGCLMAVLITMAILIATVIHPILAYISFGSFLLVAFVLGIIRWRANPPYTVAWRCSKCSYPLFGATKPVCPECGHPISEAQIKKAPPGIYRFGKEKEIRDQETEGPGD